MALSYSPLRYPGGKSKLSAYILETMKQNDLVGGTYVEPFAGGAAIAWYLPRVTILNFCSISIAFSFLEGASFLPVNN